MLSMRERLTNYFKAGFPGLAIETAEEKRAQTDVIAVAKERGRTVLTWSATEGMRSFDFSGDKPAMTEIPETHQLGDACQQRHEKACYIFRDAHLWPFNQDPVLTRALRDLLDWAPDAGSTVIVIAPSFKPHPTVEKLFTLMDYSLPDHDELAKIARNIAKSAKKDIEPDEALLRALSGLSTNEAENALALSIVETKGFDAKVIYREKVQAVKRTGLLEIIEPDPRGLDAIGGLEELKPWLKRRIRAFSKEAIEFGLPAPKGLLLVGVPGTGKSLTAKAVGTVFGFPMVKLDIGSLMGSLVGESETRTRDALQLAGAVSPCGLWIDEIDKGLAGSGGSGSSDSGVTRRVLGTILSWMQDRKQAVFLVATANQVESLPPELLRKGRFDEIFAIDLPTSKERADILSIHLKRLKRSMLDEVSTRVVVDATKGFTGSEIENAIHEAMYSAFDQGRDITGADIASAARATTPLSVTAKEQIDGIRAWAKSRARFASAKETTEQAPEVGSRQIAH